MFLHISSGIMSPAGLVVGFNISYDADILGEECRRFGLDYSIFRDMVRFCTMIHLTTYRKIPSPNGYPEYKYPKLTEAYSAVNGNYQVDCHDALVDTEACNEIFFAAIDRGIFRSREDHPTVLIEADE